MTRFIQINRSLFNVDSIEAVHRHFDKETRETIVTVQFKDGGETITTKEDLVLGDEIDMLTRIGPVPAAPGFDILRIGFDDQEGSPWVSSEPVIAWVMGASATFPVGVENGYGDDDHGTLFIRYPDGRVLAWGDKVYQNEAEWRADMVRRHKANHPI